MTISCFPFPLSISTVSNFLVCKQLVPTVREYKLQLLLGMQAAAGLGGKGGVQLWIGSYKLNVIYIKLLREIPL